MIFNWRDYNHQGITQIEKASTNRQLINNTTGSVKYRFLERNNFLDTVQGNGSRTHKLLNLLACFTNGN